MIDITLQKLIEFLQTASPVVWDSLMKQVYANAYANLFWGAFLGVLFPIILYVLIRKLGDWDDAEDGTKEIFFFFAFVFLACGCYLATIGFKELYNPTFYAIKMIIEQLPILK